MTSKSCFLAALMVVAMVAPSRGSAQNQLSSLAKATTWLNSTPLDAAGLRGKVVLVDFWTYTCINWLRTLPYIRAWADKYRDQGLVVIGVHAPEFPFEKDLANVRLAVKEMRITYPVAVDNEHAIWGGFDNQYWPALYFIDATGRVRHHHFGEGEYDESERVIQQLLAEAGGGPVARDVVTPVGRGAEAAPDWRNLKSSENYLGYGRTEGFASPGGAIPDQLRPYAAPTRLSVNQWALVGEWAIQRGATVTSKPGGRIQYQFHARDVHLVMGPATRGATVRFRILIDGKPPGAGHGVDVDAEGNGAVTEQRLYQLVRQTGAISDHVFEIQFLDPGVELYAFTFG